ncbi:unannotated protein [freshwater metagenome]|uniref:Unannotated protein n=1 Tax=freshwater metagenome TaxID=449393 RepID=A0A6J6PQG7_9ZZZZ|nr:amino acid permease [Actinomycetota bacterium]MSX45421.1 amino acid permease [Actinomycetota bacterium]MSX73344.1 amino acid permease [Actinomycetota bacterium]MSZ01200.1 amino acid permease [Actinomycetota bacterium]MTA60172.1 amino acid permease [Actinomycetota bacterium]
MSTHQSSSGLNEQDDPRLKRDLTLWNSFALGFAFISPIVALFGVLALGLTTVGPGFWWGFVITLLGQSLVALSFFPLARRWPFEGSSYQWSRRLVSEGWGWFHGWIYIVTMVVALSIIALQASQFTLPLLGIKGASQTQLVISSLVLIMFSTIANAWGKRVLHIFVTLCVWAEVVGSLGLGTVLLFFYRKNDLSVFSQGLSFPGWSHLMYAPIVIAMAYAAWGLIGFDSAASIAEEVKNPHRDVPRGILLSLIAVGITVAYAGFAFILAIPNLQEVVAGKVADPIVFTLSAIWPSWLVNAVLFDFTIAFVACLVAVQAAAARMIWAFARDNDLPKSAFLVKMSNTQMPVNAVLVTGVISSALFVFTGSGIYIMLLALATAGYYIVFFFPVVGTMIARRRGNVIDKNELPRWHSSVNAAALLWLIFMIPVILWPRTPDIPWWQNWGAFTGWAIVLVLGVIVRKSVLATRHK